MSRSSPKIPRRMRGDIFFMPMFLVGILAAIAVPAYQDYTIRAQVTEGLSLASSVKAAIADSFAQTGAWPRNLKQLEFDRTPRSRNVASVTLRNGTIFIRYGGRANRLVNGQQLTLRPSVAPQGAVHWSCGYSGNIVGADPATGGAEAHATTVQNKYLPSVCRGAPGAR